MIAVHYSSYRKSLKRYCDFVCDESEAIVVTRKKGGNVVMLSQKEYDNLIENLYIRSSWANYKNLMKSIAQLKNSCKARKRRLLR